MQLVYNPDREKLIVTYGQVDYSLPAGDGVSLPDAVAFHAVQTYGIRGVSIITAGKAQEIIWLAEKANEKFQISVAIETRTNYHSKNKKSLEVGLLVPLSDEEKEANALLTRKGLLA